MGDQALPVRGPDVRSEAPVHGPDLAGITAPASEPPAVAEARRALEGGAHPERLAELLRSHPGEREAIVAVIQSHPAGGNAVCGQVLDAMAVPKGPQPLLRIGSRGEPVRRLQQGLIKHGADLAADGAFGPKTAAAVMAFQLQSNLVADGIVGPRTWGALDGAPLEEKAEPEAERPGEPVQDDKPVQPAAPPAPTSTTGTGEGGAKTPGDRYREQYVEQLLYFEGAIEGDKKFESIMSHEGLEAQRKAHDGKTFTTCNSFSGIMQTMAEQKSGVKLKTKINLYVMDPKWREKNLPEGCFHEGGGADRPRPGDIVIFSQLDGRTFAHMGNFIEGPTPLADGMEQWQCIDGGQGQAGKYVDGVCVQQGCEQIARVTLTYNPATGTTTRGNRERKVYGWVDIAALANAAG